MRNLSIILVLVPLVGSGEPALAGCIGEGSLGCLPATTLHLSTALVGRPPRVWSPAAANLLPPAVPVRPVGRTIPLSRIVGLRVAPVGRPAEQVVYNNPDDPPGPDLGLTLVALRPQPRLALVSVSTRIRVVRRVVLREPARRAFFRARPISKRRCP